METVTINNGTYTTTAKLKEFTQRQDLGVLSTNNTNNTGIQHTNTHAVQLTKRFKPRTHPRACTVNKGRGAIKTNVEAVERVAAARHRRVHGRLGRARVLEVVESAIRFAHDHVQLAVAIDYRARRGQQPK